VNYYMLKLYVSLQNLLERVSRREEGQTAVEYGLVLALIAVVITAAMALGLNGVVDTVVTKVTNAINGA
jgi:Flp pilus assembly pilin Flp